MYNKRAALAQARARPRHNNASMVRRASVCALRCRPCCSPVVRRRRCRRLRRTGPERNVCGGTMRCHTHAQHK